jgi:hypothetical protein
MLRLLTVVIVAAAGFTLGAVLRDVMESADAAVEVPTAPAVTVEPEPVSNALRIELEAQADRVAELLEGAGNEQLLALSLVERRLEAIEAALAEFAERVPEPLPEILEVEP